MHRRVCIGRTLAENSLLIQLAVMLATVNIDWPPGPDGKPTPFEPEWSFRGQAYEPNYLLTFFPTSSR